ncbi:MAG: TetR/AcrR family transcriptional regulator [Sagittula sp.]|uniref:TetR/AcrR family transcriptional regulator n=1 Tax=Sagittula sp. TaxID=2038081 RepID=UPI0040590A3B
MTQQKRRPKATRSDGEQTRTAILDAAEVLFANNGINATSLRGIMEEAKVSVSLIHYHFGKREDLVRAVILRRIPQFEEERLSMLRRAQAATGDTKLRLLLEAYFLPTILSGTTNSTGMRTYVRFLTQLDLLGEAWADELIAEFFSDFQTRFLHEVGACFPELSETELYWRLHLLLCVGMYTAGGSGRVRKFSGNLVNPNDPKGFIDNLMPSLIAAIRPHRHDGDGPAK